MAPVNAKIGRPKIGKGAKTISLTVEKGLLKQAAPAFSADKPHRAIVRT